MTYFGSAFQSFIVLKRKHYIILLFVIHAGLALHADECLSRWLGRVNDLKQFLH